MPDLYIGSPSKMQIQLMKKKYKDIAACDVCRCKKKWCKLFCKWRNKKYIELAKVRGYR